MGVGNWQTIATSIPSPTLPFSRGGSAPSPRYVQRTDPNPTLIMVVVVMIVMTVVMVPVPVRVIMIVSMSMVMLMPMLMVMNALVRAAAARVFAEQQRLDRDRHGE